MSLITKLANDHYEKSIYVGIYIGVKKIIFIINFSEIL
jgi:hypothetical protein